MGLVLPPSGRPVSVFGLHRGTVSVPEGFVTQ